MGIHLDLGTWIVTGQILTGTEVLISVNHNGPPPITDTFCTAGKVLFDSSF